MHKIYLNARKVKVILAISLCFSSPAWAAENEVVVTANRVETEAEKLGASVTIVTAKDIERKQAQTVADALRDVPGLAVSANSGKGRDTAIRIRGAEAHHTKLIIDGVDVSDFSRSQPSYDFGHLLASDVERIEVVRGPQSLLYGGDAIGGVINIITKRGQGAPKVTAFAEAGSADSYTGSVGVKGANDRLNYALTATHFQTQGISAADKRNGNGENDPYWNQTITGNLGARLTDIWGVEASWRLMRAKVNYDDWTTRATDDTDSMTQNERSGRLATSLALFDGRLKNTFAYSAAETRRDINNGDNYWGAPNVYYDGDMQKWEYQGTAQLAENHAVVFGAESKKSSTDQSGISASITDNGYFADYQFSPIENMYLTAGGRVDDHESYGNHATWRGTAAYLIDATETRLHSSYGTGFRAPSLYELYAPTWGNASLQPEESRGWDAGVEQTFLNGQAGIDLTWFDNRIHDMIQWNATGYSNIASTRAQGIETAAYWQVAPDWRLNAAHTYTESRNNATGQVLARRPRHQGSVGVHWVPLDNWSTDTSVRMVGRQYDSATGRYLGGFATVDLAVAYDVTEFLRLFGRLENIGDKQYQEVDTYGAPGRTGFVGVKATF